MGADASQLFFTPFWFDAWLRLEQVAYGSLFIDISVEHNYAYNWNFRIYIDLSSKVYKQIFILHKW